MKFINFDDIVSKNEKNYINKNVFTPQHPCNCSIIGINILSINPVYGKIYIFTKEPEDKYNFLLKKFPNNVRIFYQNDEYNLDELIKGKYQSCCIFDDLITDDKKIMEWFVRSRKKCSNFFLAHSYFKMSKTLRLNLHYIILFKIPKNQLSQIYIDQPIYIDIEIFYKIISELNKYENILIYL